jgi:hypothetical protein
MGFVNEALFVCLLAGGAGGCSCQRMRSKLACTSSNGLKQVNTFMMIACSLCKIIVTASIFFMHLHALLPKIVSTNSALCS